MAHYCFISPVESIRGVKNEGTLHTWCYIKDIDVKYTIRELVHTINALQQYSKQSKKEVYIQSGDDFFFFFDSLSLLWFSSWNKGINQEANHSLYGQGLILRTV